LIKLKIIFIFLKIYLQKERLNLPPLFQNNYFNKLPKDHQDLNLQNNYNKNKAHAAYFVYSTQKNQFIYIYNRRRRKFGFQQKESWEFGTGSGSLAYITSVRDSLRARHDLGVAGSVSLSFFTCPLALPIWSESK
jgi:hypothetical protein